MASPNDQEAQQQLFTDTLLKLQIHAALAKENTHHNKSPLPLLAQSCSLLDNLPTTTTTTSWTAAQRILIDALKIDAWMALADGCIQTNDLIQAEAALQRLATLQDAAAGSFSWRAQKANKGNNNRRNKTTMSSDSSSNDTTASSTSSPGPTEEHRQAAEGLIQTWRKLCQVYTDMGKLDMTNNFNKRIQKMTNLLQDPVPSSTITAATSP
ncbi:hypothetical protein BG015_003625 [Linnemannia schmuckeri]|uniref:Uncharacterized protein n=1 Tax=Linnemannia schmuckeri TaxID=64567 RepID=A0A9P5VCS1_9FUNG|nr:hypothetical protein BG015_003625 [Linnemannia schmuckeri]